MPRCNNADLLHDHVVSLCRENNIRIRWQGATAPNSSAFRFIDGTYGIKIRPVSGPVNYFVAMHEIGHIMANAMEGDKIVIEAKAWMWALTEAIIKPTEAQKKKIWRRFNSYLSYASEIPAAGVVYEFANIMNQKPQAGAAPEDWRPKLHEFVTLANNVSPIYLRGVKVLVTWVRANSAKVEICEFTGKRMDIGMEINVPFRALRPIA